MTLERLQRLGQILLGVLSLGLMLAISVVSVLSMWGAFAREDAAIRERSAGSYGSAYERMQNRVDSRGPCVP